MKNKGEILQLIQELTNENDSPSVRPEIKERNESSIKLLRVCQGMTREQILELLKEVKKIKYNGKAGIETLQWLLI